MPIVCLDSLLLPSIRYKLVIVTACGPLIARHDEIDRVSDRSPLSLTGRGREVAVQVGKEWYQAIGTQGGECAVTVVESVWRSCGSVGCKS